MPRSMHWRKFAMEFKQLESFAAVVRLNSFTKAAESLYISQPTISTHIRTLEEELGTRLIMRTTKNIDVTPEGLKLFEYAVNILELRDRMMQECSAGSRQIIHLGASTIPSAYILPEVLPTFGKLYPNAFFIIHQTDSKGVVEGLTDGIYDVGLIGMPCGKETLHSEPFCKDRMVLVTPVSEEYLTLQGNGASPEEILRTHPVILREKGSGSKKSADFFLSRRASTKNPSRFLPVSTIPRPSRTWWRAVWACPSSPSAQPAISFGKSGSSPLNCLTLPMTGICTWSAAGNRRSAALSGNLWNSWSGSMQTVPRTDGYTGRK